MLPVLCLVTPRKNNPYFPSPPSPEFADGNNIFTKSLLLLVFAPENKSKHKFPNHLSQGKRSMQMKRKAFSLHFSETFPHAHCIPLLLSNLRELLIAKQKRGVFVFYHASKKKKKPFTVLKRFGTKPGKIANFFFFSPPDMCHSLSSLYLREL